jgi:hypothetical protein
MMGGRMMGGGMMGGMGATESAGNYWKTDEKKVMIRAFDFTVAPDTSYRYRVRIVVFNPNYKREDVNPGVDTKKKFLRSDWSAATDEVHVLPDVMPYVFSTEPPSANSDMKVLFQVIRFRTDDGVTVPRNFPAGPGELIGGPRTAEVPASDGTKTKSATMDFNSRQIVLDLYANKKTRGLQYLPAGFDGSPIDRPVVALLLRKDGSVAVHSEANDVTNEVRKDIEANYNQEIKDSGKERTNSFGAGMRGMGGMMGAMGGMRGGGMGAGNR